MQASSSENKAPKNLFKVGGLRRVVASRKNSPEVTIPGRDHENEGYMSSPQDSNGPSGKKGPIVESTSQYASSTTSNFTNPFESHHTQFEDSEVAAINNSIDALPPTVIVFMIAVLTSFCGFMFGYDTGYISGALVIMKESDLNTTLTSGHKELITSATSLGALVTSLMGGTMADAFGRKWVISFANIMFIVGAIMQTAAHSLWVMIVGRFIMGFGVGFASLVAPMYLSELAPTKYRGRLVVMNVLAITFGQLVAYAIGAGLTHVHNGWRILVGLSLIPSVSQMAIFVFMPESPRYLVSRGKTDAAKAVLKKIYKGATDEQAAAKVAEITSDVPVSAVTSSDNVPYKKKVRSAIISFNHNLHELFTKPANLRGLIIIVTLQALQQFSGWNSLLYYSGTMFESVGFASPTAVSIIIAGTNFVFTGVAFLIIDKIGRRVLLVGTMWGMVVGLVMCSIAFHWVKYSPDGGMSPNDSPTGWSIVIIVFIFVYAMSYASGIGNIPWQQAELLPMQVRGIGTSFATAMNWSGSLIISATFLTMLDNITPTGTFAFYAAICFVGWLLAIFFYPETAGLNLEEIQGLLQGGFNVKESVALSKRKLQLLTH